MPSHVLDYLIHGDDMQFVELTLDPGETVIAEAGAMMFMDDGVQMATRMGDGSKPDGGMLDALFSVGKRVLTGESLFMTHFTATERRAKVAFGAPYPGRIVAVDLAAIGGTFLCQKQSFLCAALGTAMSIAFTRRFGAGLFGGEGFILQKLLGDGLAFVHAGGAVLRRDLKPGERLLVDTGCIVGFEERVDYDIQMVKGVGSMLFGGEGLFLATLQGPGSVWLQSLPFSRLADRVLAAAPRYGGKNSEEGSVLGGIGRIIGGRWGGPAADARGPREAEPACRSHAPHRRPIRGASGRRPPGRSSRDDPRQLRKSVRGATHPPSGTTVHKAARRTGSDDLQLVSHPPLPVLRATFRDTPVSHLVCSFHLLEAES